VRGVAGKREGQLGGGPGEAGRGGGRLAEVAPQPQHLDLRVLAGERLQLGERAVRAAVVHEQDLVGQSQGLQRLPQPLVQRREVVPLVLDRNHDGQVHARLASGKRLSVTPLSPEGRGERKWAHAAARYSPAADGGSASAVSSAIAAGATGRGKRPKR